MYMIPIDSQQFKLYRNRQSEIFSTAEFQPLKVWGFVNEQKDERGNEYSRLHNLSCSTVV